MDVDVNQQILTEVRNFARWSKRTSIAVLVLLLIFVAANLWMLPSQTDPYAKVSSAMRNGDYTGALQMAHRLVEQHPENYYRHEYLAGTCLQADDVVCAEQEYAKAYSLYPSEGIAKSLAAVRKRRAEASPAPSSTP
jgi:predicted Zn-dependent protease